MPHKVIPKFTHIASFIRTLSAGYPFTSAFNSRSAPSWKVVLMAVLQTSSRHLKTSFFVSEDHNPGMKPLSFEARRYMNTRLALWLQLTRVDKNHGFYFFLIKEIGFIWFKSDFFDLNQFFWISIQIVTKRFYLLFYLKQLKWHRPRILYKYLYVHRHNIILQNNQKNFSRVIFWLKLW